jgi:hypothetical protein
MAKLRANNSSKQKGQQKRIAPRSFSRWERWRSKQWPMSTFLVNRSAIFGFTILRGMENVREVIFI